MFSNRDSGANTALLGTKSKIKSPAKHSFEFQSRQCALYFDALSGKLVNLLRRMNLRLKKKASRFKSLKQCYAVVRGGWWQDGKSGQNGPKI